MSERQARIQELKALIAERESALWPLREELQKLQVAEEIDAAPFKPGDTIEWVAGSHGTRRGSIVHAKRWCGGEKFEYWVEPILKNGTVGKRVWIQPWHNPRRTEPK